MQPEDTNATAHDILFRENALVQSPGDSRSAEVGDFLRVPLDQIETDPQQVRRTNKSAECLETQALAASLAAHGLMHPPSVIALGPCRYRVVVGERRVVAARLLQWEEITVQLVDVATPERRALSQLHENLFRLDLGTYELALAVFRLQKSENFTNAQLARELGRSPTWVTKLTKIAECLLSEIADLLVGSPQDNIEVHYELSQLPSDRQRQLAEKAVNENLTTRQIRLLSRESVSPPKCSCRGSIRTMAGLLRFEIDSAWAGARGVHDATELTPGFLREFCDVVIGSSESTSPTPAPTLSAPKDDVAH